MLITSEHQSQFTKYVSTVIKTTDPHECCGEHKFGYLRLLFTDFG